MARAADCASEQPAAVKSIDDEKSARSGSSQSAIVAVAVSPAKRSAVVSAATVSVVPAVSRSMTPVTVMDAEESPSEIVTECGTSR